MSKFKKYYETVAFLEGLKNLPPQKNYLSDKHPDGIYLKRMRYFLDLLGNPDQELNFIHIAGTAGKGMVTSMVHEILNIAGMKVGSFTSPSVVTSIEKIRVGNEYIDPDEFVGIVEDLKPYLHKSQKGPFGAPSYFEIFLAIALVYFKKQKCQYVVLETGLGGRYDATNVIKSPLITAITNIDYDHTDILGKTLKKIAQDKAGIIKEKSIFFTTEQRPSIVKIFKEICKEKHVSYNLLPKQNNYQNYNRELASAIARNLGVEDQYIQKGLDSTKLMCRFEIVQDKPIVVLDGAHNRSKIKTAIENLRGIEFKKLHLIIAIADNKDHVSILKQIIPEADYIYFITLKNLDRRFFDPNDLLDKSKPYLKKGIEYEVSPNPEIALSLALKRADKKDLVLVVGSFFLAGQLRKQWFSEESILENRKSF